MDCEKILPPKVDYLGPSIISSHRLTSSRQLPRRFDSVDVRRSAKIRGYDYPVDGFANDHPNLRSKRDTSLFPVEAIKREFRERAFRCYFIVVRGRRSDDRRWYGNIPQFQGFFINFFIGAKWKHNRKVISPTFSQVIINNFVPIFEKNSKILVDELREKADGRTRFPVYYTLAKHLSKTILGMNFIRLNRLILISF